MCSLSFFSQFKIHLFKQKTLGKGESEPRNVVIVAGCGSAGFAAGAGARSQGQPSVRGGT